MEEDKVPSYAISSTSFTAISGKYPSPSVFRMLLGDIPINPHVVQTFEEYSDITRIRHDIIHACIAVERQLPFPEQAVEELVINAGLVVNYQDIYDKIKKQTPDMMTLTHASAKIVELTISRHGKAITSKQSKYALLCYWLNKMNINYDLEVIVINPDTIYSQRDKLIKQHKLTEPIIDRIDYTCKRYEKLLYSIREIKDTLIWDAKILNIDISDQSVEYDKKDCLDAFFDLKNKSFHDVNDLNSIFNSVDSHLLNSNDDDFLNETVNQAFNINPPMMTSQKFDLDSFKDKINQLSNIRPELKHRLRSFFPLPYFKTRSIDASYRSTFEDFDRSLIISQLMMMCEDVVLREFGSHFSKHFRSLRKEVIKPEDYGLQFKFSQDAQYQISLEGPGRKALLKKGDITAKIESEKYDAMSLDFDTDVTEIFPLLFQLSHIKKPKIIGSLIEDSNSLSKLSGFGLDYVKLCQSIFREININGLRSDRRRKHYFKPTGVNGVYLLIYKGNKLRTGEQVGLVWFKLIIDNEELLNDQPVCPWAFKSLNRDLRLSHSNWLSTDAHRLDHYIRSYDKILMAYYSVLSYRYKLTLTTEENNFSIGTPTIIESVSQDITNTLGLIIAIYMEDKRSTSKMLQMTRYLVMTSVSIYKYYNDVMAKVVDRIRTPLQLYLLKRLVKYIELMESHKISEHYKCGFVRYNKQDKIFDDSRGGAMLYLPRPLIETKGQNIADFPEILSEMYFTMLFNKNQDDPTHASFQILKKMLEAESNFQSVKEKGLHLGYSQEMSDVEFMKLIVNTPKIHQFSRKAIEIGSILVRKECNDPHSVQIELSANLRNVNKPLDQFATFKATSNVDRLEFSENTPTQNSRTKCVEKIMGFLKQDLYDSFDVANTYKHDLTTFQIFKKNQIGGVREILILTMQSRVMINILETVSRNICSKDPREMLTHGSTKLDNMKSILYKAKKLEGRRVPLFFSYDKSQWGPSFVPIQFLYLFTRFRTKLKSLFPFFCHLLMRHQNKVCLYPEKLVSAWVKDQENKYNINDPNLANLKEKFLSGDRSLFFTNESNMGQGILHYTSSYLHLALISFRNEVYKRMLEVKGIFVDDQEHNDLISSDDSFTVFSLPINDKHNMRIKLNLFMKAQYISELLFSSRTSTSKSSISPVVGEFNSVFVSNLTFFPTLIKFAIASVHPVNTDSFYRMVKESYAASRQIMENGGSLELYTVSHFLNKEFCESIYHTNIGGFNDLRKHGLNNIPFQLGEYPIFEPSLMLAFGPEYNNYLIFKKFDSLSELEKRLFINSHKIIKTDNIEVLSSFDTGEMTLGGLIKIEIKMGPIRQLKRFQALSILSREDLRNKIVEDPFIIVDSSRNPDIIKFRASYKLFVDGAKEAVKFVCPSIYYGRMSASVSANAFYVPGINGEDGVTYLTCINNIIQDTPMLNFKDQFKFIYPRWEDYEACDAIKFVRVNPEYRDPFEVQTINKLMLHKIYTKMTYNAIDVLKFMWYSKLPEDYSERKMQRDVSILQSYYPIIKSTKEETLSQFNQEDPTQLLTLLILKLYTLKDRSFKGIFYGHGSFEVNESLWVLHSRNTSPGLVFEVTQQEKITGPRTIDYSSVYLAHNYALLQEFSEEKKRFDPWSNVNTNSLNLFLNDPSINKSIKKRVFMMLMIHNKIDNVEDWSRSLNVVLHYWKVRQKYNINTNSYSGPGSLLLFKGRNQLEVNYHPYRNYFKIHKHGLDDSDELMEFMAEAADLYGLTLVDFINLITDRGPWHMKDNKLLHLGSGGFNIVESQRSDDVYPQLSRFTIDYKLIEFFDENNKKMMASTVGIIPTITDPPDYYPDFIVFGLSFKKMVRFGVFSGNFSLLSHTQNESLEMLDDINVNAPIVTEKVKKELNLPTNWHTMDFSDVNEVSMQDVTRVPEPDFKENDYLASLMWEGDEKIEDVISYDWLSGNINELIDFIDHFDSTELFATMKTENEIFYPRKSFLNVLNLKHQIVCHQLIPDLRINSPVIEGMMSKFKNKLIGYSLIAVYNMYFYEGQQEPPFIVNVRENPSFINKFNLKITKSVGEFFE